MNILGIDWGGKKIGLAIANDFLAEPLGIINNLGCEEKIKNICQKEKIQKIIIGISEGKSAVETEEFGEKLKRVTNMPVEYEDETLTSQEAVAKMKQVRRKIGNEDAVSAALILQSYLDRQS